MDKIKVTKKQAQADRSRVSAIYGRVANGVQVPIMSLGRIMDAGLAAVAAGGDDAAVAAAVRQAVDRVRACKEDMDAERAGIRAIAHRL